MNVIARQSSPQDRCVSSAACRIAVGLCLLVFLGGCADDDQLSTEYGRRHGRAGASLNGTSVLAEMFRQAGGRPATVLQLSDSLDYYDVIVWVPDDFSVPDIQTRTFLETWLAAGPQRTVIYVGRDYDAACDYWQAVLSTAPVEQRQELMLRAAETRAEHSYRRVEMPQEEICDWFVMRRDMPGQRVTRLQGPWSQGVVVQQAEIWRQGQLDIPTADELKTLEEDEASEFQELPQYTPLLLGDDQLLAFEVSKPTWPDSRIVIVTNGSFLLNFPLVNHQHRKLADRVIRRCQPFARVAFLESGPEGPYVMSSPAKAEPATLRSRVMLAAHWLVLGAMFCFSVFPIFGRPKPGKQEVVADFGQHVDAVAALLERTGDVDYAHRQITAYRTGRLTNTG